MLYAEGVWKGGIIVADIEELGNSDASEIHCRRLNAREIITPKMVLYSQSQMERPTCLEETTTSENLLQRAEISEENFKEIGEVSTDRRKQKMTQRPVMIFLSMEGDFICRHHVEPRVQFCVPKGFHGARMSVVSDGGRGSAWSPPRWSTSSGSGCDRGASGARTERGRRAVGLTQQEGIAPASFSV